MILIDPAALQNNLLAGTILMVIELIIVYILIGFALSFYEKRREDRMWNLARRDFVAKTLFTLSHASYTATHLSEQTEEHKHLNRKFDYIASLFETHSENLELLAIKYNPALPPDWLYTSAQVTERIKTARHWLAATLVNVERYSQLVGGNMSSMDGATLRREYIKVSEDEGAQFLTQGDVLDNLKAQISEGLYATCEEVIRAIDTMSAFADERFKDSDLDETDTIQDLMRRKKFGCQGIKAYMAEHTERLEAIMAALVSGEFHFAQPKAAFA
ncbi:MAG: hypothetical protein AAF559_11200 [Pseudomonadota bacterium]